MSEEIALFIDFENIRYSLLNIQHREPDPQELISVARHYGTVMVARAYADWTRQPDQFKGSLMAAMIDRVDCPAKQRDRLRPYWVNAPATASGESRPLDPSSSGYGLSAPVSEDTPEEDDDDEDQQNESLDDYSSESAPNGYGGYSATGQSNGLAGQTLSGPLGPLVGPGSSTSFKNESSEGPRSGPLSNPSSGNTGSMGVIQSTVSQSTVDLNMLMDIIETVFDRPTIGTFVLMTGDRDFTRISARLKLRLNKTVIIVGVPGTVSRDLISAASQFVALTLPGAPTMPGGPGSSQSFPSSIISGATGPMPAVGPMTFQGTGAMPALVDPLEPGFIQFLDYIDRNWSWRTVIGISNFVGDSINPKNRFRGRLTRESARELLNICIQEKILLAQQDAGGGEDLRLNRAHPQVEEVLRQLARS
ncbi:MAG TPA: NYN domain-containing protein [Ktedonobacterales bacterium]|nr:NYN domain-containing protein [Ktedonobacterales bacterium]